MNSTLELPPSGERVLALDYGQKRVGVAVSDVLLLMAHGRETLQYRSQRDLLDRLLVIIKREGVSLIVVGLPRNMNGTEGEMSQKVRAFIAVLEQHAALPVVAWDERLSSRQAERTLTALGKSTREQRQVVDQVAAVFILQSYLDNLATQRRQSA
ncbi:MAG: Holliday junction resolvase RuvX [candidate division KSB1 bacterium]